MSYVNLLVKVNKGSRRAQLAKALSSCLQIHGSVKWHEEHLKLSANVLLTSNGSLERLAAISGIERVHIGLFQGPLNRSSLRHLQQHRHQRLLPLQAWQKWLGKQFPQRWHLKMKWRQRDPCDFSRTEVEAAVDQMFSYVVNDGHGQREAVPAQRVVEEEAADVTLWCGVKSGHLFCGLPVLARARYERPWSLPYWGLHPNIAWAMGQLANPMPGEIVVDPLCGRATLLIHIAHSWPHCGALFGFDVDKTQLSKAEENVKSSNLNVNVNLEHADVTHGLPMPSSFADLVLSDLPFGRQHGSAQDNKSLYPSVVTEISRILRHGGRGLVITTNEFVPLLHNAIIVAGLNLVETVQFRFGRSGDQELCIAVAFTKPGIAGEITRFSSDLCTTDTQHSRLRHESLWRYSRPAMSVYSPQWKERHRTSSD